MAHVRLIYAKKGEAEDLFHVIVCTAVNVELGGIYYKEVEESQDYYKIISIGSIKWYHICADIYFT